MMHIVVYGPERRVGVQIAEGVVDVAPDLGRFIATGQAALDEAKAAVEHVTAKKAGAPVIQTGVEIHAPFVHGARVAFAGGNYADHLEAMMKRRPPRPGDPKPGGDFRAAIRERGIWGGWKVDRAPVGPGGAVKFPKGAKYFDYEGELAIIIGKEARNVKAADAAKYVWGVTLFMDWSLRDVREAAAQLTFALGKNFDNSYSLGPSILVGGRDFNDLTIETYVNGDRRQHFRVGDAVYSHAEYIEYITRHLTLYPGDVLSGGTAAGTAADSSPPGPDGRPSTERFLKPGDKVELRCPEIGTLASRIVE